MLSQTRDTRPTVPPAVRVMRPSCVRAAGTLPAPRFVGGMVLVLASIALYNKKPEPKAKAA